MLKIDNIEVVYPNGVRALVPSSFTMPTGVLCGIIGANGSGKSSLLKGIMGLIPALGSVTLDDKPFVGLSKKVAYIEQRESIDKDFPITLFDAILTGTYPRLGFFKRPRNNERLKVRDAIEKLGLSGLEKRQIGELSGGQFQRLLFARALVQDADFFFLDEPFVGIDVTSERIIVDLLKELAAAGKTLFVVHHDLSKVRSYFSHVVLLNSGVIAAGKVDDVFNRKNLKLTFDMLKDPIFSEL